MNETIDYNPDSDGYAIILPTPHPKADSFDILFNAGIHGAEDQMRALWVELRDAWLRTKQAKSDSDHTRRSYETATVEWWRFLSTCTHGDSRTVQLWEATSAHVRAWQQSLFERGLSPSTINQRLAACSSFYSFVIRERGLVRGVEVTAFMDITGRTRENPFYGGNVQRARTQKYGNARKLSAKETSTLIAYLESQQHTINGSRNYALLLGYLMTGYRNTELVSLKWGAIRPNASQPGAYVVAWKGKGAKEQTDALPNRVYHAICAYLKTSGRHPDTMQPDDYIFKPISVHGLSNLKNHKEEPTTGHISEKQVGVILNNCLRNAGVEGKMRVHDLRHTFAKRFRKINGDMEALRERLHHESLATTGIYIRDVLDDPVDSWSEGLYQNLRFEF